LVTSSQFATDKDQMLLLRKLFLAVKDF